MRLRTRGLLVGGVDRRLYVTRPALEAALLDPMLSGGNVLILGPSGSGKTTSLRKLAVDLEARNERVCLINAALADTAEQLMDLVLRGVDRQAPPVRPATQPVLDTIRQLAAIEPSHVLIDGPLSAHVGRELFGRLRDELWSLEHRWALTSSEIAATPLRLPPANAFWDRVVKLPEFAGVEIDRLLEQGLDEHECDELRAMGWQAPAPAWPRAVVRSVRDCFEGTTLVPADEIDALRRAKAELERIPSMTLLELEALRRPAAASDPELLKRLGYSRAYVARALAQLEQLGLVVSSPESTEGRAGRPRKLYEPALIEAYT